MSDTVYVIGARDSDTVKIGVSNRVARRLREIQFMSPIPLAVLWSTPGSYSLENALHRHFAPFRSHGEWFKFPEDPVKTVRDAWAVLRFALDDAGGFTSWPDAPMGEKEEYLHLWLNRRVRKQLYRGSFTFPEAAETINAPLAFVATYGAKLAKSGQVVDQRTTRNGQTVYCASWDQGERWDLLGGGS